MPHTAPCSKVLTCRKGAVRGAAGRASRLRTVTPCTTRGHARRNRAGPLGSDLTAVPERLDLVGGGWWVLPRSPSGLRERNSHWGRIRRTCRLNCVRSPFGSGPEVG